LLLLLLRFLGTGRAPTAAVATDHNTTATPRLQVPELWARAAYPSLKPLASWVADFQARVAAMAAWLAGGPPACFWLPGFFFPQGFMTGVLQMHARKYAIPVDTLGFAFEVGTRCLRWLLLGCWLLLAAAAAGLLAAAAASAA
jgi:hypothetical protein